MVSDGGWWCLVVDDDGWCWVVVDIFCPQVDASGWLWRVAVSGGGRWHSLV